MNEDSSKKKDVNNKNVIVLIHGVGNPVEGSILEEVMGNIGSDFTDIDVVEINWNTIVDKVLDGEKIKYNSIKDLARSLRNSFRVSSIIPDNKASQYIYKLNSKLYILLEFSLLIPGISIVFIFPIFYFLNYSNTSDFISYLDYIKIMYYILNQTIWLFYFITFLMLLNIFIDKNLNTFYEYIRKLVLLLFRPTILMILSPYIFGLSRSEETRNFTWKFPLYILFFSTIFIGFDIAYHNSYILNKALVDIKHFAFNEFYLTNIFIIIFAIFPLAVTTCLSVISMGLLGPATKILLDIFMYIGDVNYRSKIQDYFHDKVIKYGSDTNFYIISHSLGSVIAVDSLVNNKLWKKYSSITLLTMGSPIRRLFSTFFPNAFFPTDFKKITSSICSNCIKFRWINIYRPFDQIGGSLGIPNTNFSAEFNTGQYNKFISAHINYFSDTLVKKEFVNLLNQLEFSPDNGVDEYIWPEFNHYQIISNIHFINNFLISKELKANILLIFTFFIFPMGLYLNIKSSKKIILQRNNEIQTLKLNGKLVKAEVVAKTYFLTKGRLSYESHKFDLYIMDKDLKRKHISFNRIDINEPDYKLLNEEDSLFTYVRSRGVLEKNPSPYKSRSLLNSTLRNVPILYSSTIPNSVYFVNIPENKKIYTSKYWFFLIFKLIFNFFAYAGFSLVISINSLTLLYPNINNNKPSDLEDK